MLTLWIKTTGLESLLYNSQVVDQTTCLDAVGEIRGTMRKPASRTHPNINASTLNCPPPPNWTQKQVHPMESWPTRVDLPGLPTTLVTVFCTNCRLQTIFKDTPMWRELQLSNLNVTGIWTTVVRFD